MGVRVSWDFTEPTDTGRMQFGENQLLWGENPAMYQASCTKMQPSSPLSRPM